MKKIFIAILFALVSLVSCVSQNDLDIMYGEAYMADVEYAEKYYERVDSLINCSYGHYDWDFDTKWEKKVENLNQLRANFDYAQFRFNYYTNKPFKKFVDECFKNLGCYLYKGEYHTYRIDRKPPVKKYRYVCITTDSIVD